MYFEIYGARSDQTLWLLFLRTAKGEQKMKVLSNVHILSRFLLTTGLGSANTCCIKIRRLPNESGIFIV